MKDTGLTGTGLVIVAHPDDEVLWAGGTMLMSPAVRWTVLTLCRKSDPDRNPRFHRVMQGIGATGIMGDLDDGPEQHPLSTSLMKETMLSLLPRRTYDIIITHSPDGEYTRHLRHEETSLAVQELWRRSELVSPALWLFAYEDGGRAYPPRVIPDAHRILDLDVVIHAEKVRLITNVYGFDPVGFEGLAAGPVEAFWVFDTAEKLDKWLAKETR